MCYLNPTLTVRLSRSLIYLPHILLEYSLRPEHCEAIQDPNTSVVLQAFITLKRAQIALLVLFDSRAPETGTSATIRTDSFTRLENLAGVSKRSGSPGRLTYTTGE